MTLRQLRDGLSSLRGVDRAAVPFLDDARAAWLARDPFDFFAAHAGDAAVLAGLEPLLEPRR